MVVAVIVILLTFPGLSITDPSSMFIGIMPNVTVSTGREAIFTCAVDNVANFKVAFLRVDTQTILTIDDTIITRSARIGIRYSVDKDDSLSTRQKKTWQMSLKDVTAADAGAYMCQLNIEPMVSQVTYLHVTVPPDILVSESSSDLTVTEGGNATLKCSATGYPEPNITWRREDYQPIHTNQTDGDSGVVEGSVLNLVAVQRRQMAAYLCIASNGIPPPVSKRILFRVEYPPDIVTSQTNIIQNFGEPLILHCQCQSWPQGITHWTHESNLIPTEKTSVKMSTQNRMKIESATIDMNLHLDVMQQENQGNYTCHCSNALGTANRTISVKGLARMDKQRMPAQSLSVHSESQQEDMNHDFSSPTSVTTVMATTSTRQTARPPRPSKKSKSPISTTTQRIDEANYTTEEVNKRTVGPLLQQHRRKETNSGVPTSFTSKASTPTTTISLYLLLFIRFLIDNHPPA